MRIIKAINQKMNDLILGALISNYISNFVQLSHSKNLCLILNNFKNDKSEKLITNKNS